MNPEDLEKLKQTVDVLARVFTAMANSRAHQLAAASLHLQHHARTLLTPGTPRAVVTRATVANLFGAAAFLLELPDEDATWEAVSGEAAALQETLKSSVEEAAALGLEDFPFHAALSRTTAHLALAGFLPPHLPEDMSMEARHRELRAALPPLALLFTLAQEPP